MLADAATSHLHLFSTGVVPGWVGVLIFAGAAAFVLFQLRRDLAGINPTRLTRWVLPSLRIAIVALFAWLICQPVLLIERHWTPAPQVLVMVDSGNSMRVNEGAGNISRQLDALEAAGQRPVEKRNSAASQIARACTNAARATLSALTALREAQDAATTGLPLGPSVSKQLDAVTTQLRKTSTELAEARAQLPADVGDKAMKKSVADLSAAAQKVGVAMDGLVADGGVVAREANKSPTLLDGYVNRLKKLSADSGALQKSASAMQEKLDAVLLTAKDVEAVRARPLTRQSLAELAADRLATNVPAGQAAPTWTRQPSALSTALDDVFHRTLTSPLASVVLLSDGSVSVPVTPNATAASLSQLHVPVDTVLIGTDGEEPADAGLIAVDVPRIVPAGDAVNIRCLVKNLVRTTPPPKLMLTIGKEVIGSRDLTITKDGPETIEFPWTPAAAGRVQLIFRIESAQPDAYPGNESSAAVVDVLNNKAHVLVASDRLSEDFAAVSQILAAAPAVDVRSIVAAPGLSKFHTGAKSDEFPATAEDFKALSMLVLIGDVPEATGKEVIASLKQAIDAGLRVWVQAPVSGSGKSWSSVLGIETMPIAGRHPLEPVKDLWLDLYQLGRDTDESATRWSELPAASDLNEVVTSGISLLSCDGRPVMQLVPRKSGAILVSGISDFAALRHSASAGSVNRLLSQSLSLALAPINEPGTDGGMFPPQPVYGRNVLLFGNASAGKGIDAVDGASGLKTGRVSNPQSVNISAGSTAIERAVRHLITAQDFRLAAHAAPLEKIAGETGGRHRDLLSMSDLLPGDLRGVPRSSVRRVALWPGVWSLLVLLVLVSAEYLLRRRAGKVM